jgi:hypothetical protein
MKRKRERGKKEKEEKIEERSERRELLRYAPCAMDLPREEGEGRGRVREGVGRVR